MFRLEGDEFLLTVICNRDERTYDIKMRLLADFEDYLQQLVTLSKTTNLTHAGVPHNNISESMGHSVDSNITNRYIDAFPLAQQMEFNSRLLKLNDDADIMEELKGLKEILKSRGNRGF